MGTRVTLGFLLAALAEPDVAGGQFNWDPRMPNSGTARTSASPQTPTPSPARRRGDALVTRGDALLRQGMPQWSALFFRRALRIEPRASTARKLADALMLAHQVSNAIAVYQQLLTRFAAELTESETRTVQQSLETARMALGTLRVETPSPHELEVILDGRPIGTVRRGDPMVRPVDPGAHLIRWRLGSAYSTGDHVQVTRGAELRLTAKAPIASSATASAPHESRSRTPVVAKPTTKTTLIRGAPAATNHGARRRPPAWPCIVTALVAAVVVPSIVIAAR